MYRIFFFFKVWQFNVILRSIFHCNCLLFCGLILGLLILDVKFYRISERHVQLCMVNPPHACYKFMLLNFRDCFPFVVYTRHSERAIVERKKPTFSNFVLSGGIWGNNELKITRRREVAKERGNLKSELGGRWKMNLLCSSLP